MELRAKIPEQAEGLPGEVDFTKDQIQQRVVELAQELAKEADENTVFVVALSGGIPFFVDTIEAIRQLRPDYRPIISFIRTQTYHGQEAGVTQVIDNEPLDPDFEDFAVEVGAEIIDLRTVPEDARAFLDIKVLDDINDTNRTGTALGSYYLDGLGVASYELISMFNKQLPIERKLGLDPVRFGFLVVGEPWLIGYGMNRGYKGDGPDAYRYLDHVRAVPVL
jgi:hypoxanthine-guanine phosphoribosyltransferase